MLIFVRPDVLATLSDGSVDGTLFRAGLLAEAFTLMLALFSIKHIYEYEHGGKFNPLVPLMMVGPGLAGLLNLMVSIKAFQNPHKLLAFLGLAGGAVCAVGAGMAIRTMAQSMKEAKVQGELKKKAMREARMAERSRNRSN
ncbi:MAG: hypothetical protein R3E96_13320 [Planctomycetota bacterium]